MGVEKTKDTKRNFQNFLIEMPSFFRVMAKSIDIFAGFEARNVSTVLDPASNLQVLVLSTTQK